MNFAAYMTLLYITFFHNLLVPFLSLCIWLYVFMLRFNFVNYKLIFIVIFMYYYCYLLSVMGILLQCVVLYIVLCKCVLYYCHRE